MLDFPSRDGLSVQAIRVDYEPGGFTRGTHRHPAGAYVYVIDGSVKFAVGDGEPIVLKAGESFYEPSNALHSVSRNASEDVSASLIAFFVLGDSESSVPPLETGVEGVVDEQTLRPAVARSGELHRLQTEASAEVLFDTGGRSLDRPVLLSSRGRGSTIEAQEIRDRRSPMNTALLVLRIIPGLLLMGHGLQKLVPPAYSPPLLHAAGHRGTGAAFERLGIQPAVMAAVVAGSAELVAGFSLAAGLLTPVGTVLVGAVMITAILKVHVSNGIWAAEGGFEFPLVLLTVGFAITALGPGSLSVDSWLEIDNWAGINWTINPAARSAIALAVGLAGGLVVALASWASKPTQTHASPQAAG